MVKVIIRERARINRVYDRAVKFSDVEDFFNEFENGKRDYPFLEQMNNWHELIGDEKYLLTFEGIKHVDIDNTHVTLYFRVFKITFELTQNQFERIMKIVDEWGVKIRI